MLELLRATIQLISVVTGVVMAANGHIPAPIIKERVIMVEVTPLPTQTLSPTPTPKKIIKVIIKDSPTPPPVEDLTIKVNQYRKNLGLNLLSTKTEICLAADRRLGEIAGSFNHDGFLAAIAPLKARAYAENIWRGEPFSLDRVISEWDASPGHRQNLRGNFDFGCGANNGKQAVYIFIR